NSISANDDGDVYMTGIFYTTASFGSLSVTEASMAGDMFIVKYDNQGTPVWVKKGGGNFQDLGNGCSAEADPNGSVYVTGLFAGNSNFSGQSLSASGPSDAFIAKYNTFGTLTYVAKGGGNSNDQGKAVVANGSDGTFCFVGSYTGTAAFGSNSITAAAGTWETFFACADGGTVGITESFENTGLNLYPNPTNDACTISFDEAISGTLTISVFDVLGSLMFENKIQANEKNIVHLDTGALSAGVYMVYIESDEFITSSKLVKK
ncbi:MAG: T9SS type A sorting domain-containing protein, partial [Bacteroidia bacterium]|nr:T9SS type A sorting domain-containing protein [Bacteroidia bacterium]